MKQGATLDSSFWINAHRAGLLQHVLNRYEIYSAPAVAAELSERFESGREFWRLLRAGVLTQVNPNSAEVTDFGPGEREAMNLAVEHPVWMLLVDDRRPLQEAHRRGIAAICTPVLVLALFREKVFEREQALLHLARLAALQTVSPVLIEAALAQLEMQGGGQGG